MTYSKEVTLWCDGDECEEWVKFGVSAVENAVARSKDDGWTSPSWDEHYCSDCSEER